MIARRQTRAIYVDQEDVRNPAPALAPPLHPLLGDIHCPGAAGLSLTGFLFFCCTLPVQYPSRHSTSCCTDFPYRTNILWWRLAGFAPSAEKISHTLLFDQQWCNPATARRCFLNLDFKHLATQWEFELPMNHWERSVFVSASVKCSYRVIFTLHYFFLKFSLI